MSCAESERSPHLPRRRGFGAPARSAPARPEPDLTANRPSAYALAPAGELSTSSPARSSRRFLRPACRRISARCSSGCRSSRRALWHRLRPDSAWRPRRSSSPSSPSPAIRSAPTFLAIQTQPFGLCLLTLCCLW